MLFMKSMQLKFFILVLAEKYIDKNKKSAGTDCPRWHVRVY